MFLFLFAMRLGHRLFVVVVHLISVILLWSSFSLFNVCLSFYTLLFLALCGPSLFLICSLYLCVLSQYPVYKSLRITDVSCAFTLCLLCCCCCCLFFCSCANIHYIQVDSQRIFCARLLARIISLVVHIGCVVYELVMHSKMVCVCACALNFINASNDAASFTIQIYFPLIETLKIALIKFSRVSSKQANRTIERYDDECDAI